MSCCGNKREELLDLSNGPGQSPGATGPGMPAPGIYFEYTGNTGLTVIGAVTQLYYRFNGKGDRQMVDHRDAEGMAAVPVLRNIMDSPV